MGKSICEDCQDDDKNNESIAIKLRTPRKNDTNAHNRQSNNLQRTKIGLNKKGLKVKSANRQKKLKSFYHDEIEQLE